jgi:hypothetical protein
VRDGSQEEIPERAKEKSDRAVSKIIFQKIPNEKCWDSIPVAQTSVCEVS